MDTRKVTVGAMDTDTATAMGTGTGMNTASDITMEASQKIFLK